MGYRYMSGEYCINEENEDLSKCSNARMVDCNMSEGDDQVSPDDIQYDRGEDMMLGSSIVSDELTAYLASSGLAGISAAAAIASARRSNKTHSFEVIPAVRKRQSTRLLRKMQHLIEEYNVRVGQQAIILVCNPKVAFKQSMAIENSSGSNLFKVYGSSPLEGVVRNLKPVIVQELDNALRNYQMIHEQSLNSTGNGVWNVRGDELPPLMVDGIPTPLDKMTQAQLRAFIPVMLKYSTGRGKPGWGRPSARPHWWPEDVPWANVRSDVRNQDEKANVSWTAALKKVVRRCYEYHGREDLLSDYSSHGDQVTSDMGVTTQILDMDSQHPGSQRHMILGGSGPNEVQDPSHQAVYTLGMMHMAPNDPTSASHFTHLHPSYSFKTETDGTYSIIRVDGANSKSAEAASIEAAAALEDYTSVVQNDVTGPTSTDDINLQQYAASGGMVSLPAGTVMQLDSNSTAALLSIFAGTSKVSNGHSNEQRDSQGKEIND